MKEKFVQECRVIYCIHSTFLLLAIARRALKYLLSVDIGTQDRLDA